MAIAGERGAVERSHEDELRRKQSQGGELQAALNPEQYRRPAPTHKGNPPVCLFSVSEDPHPLP